MRRFNFLLVVVLVFPYFSFSQAQKSGATDNDLQLNTITTALPFLSITPDSRAGGMGEAGTALSGNATSVYWNASMLSFAKNRTEVGLSYVPWLRQLTNDISLSYLSGYYKVNNRHSVGGSLRYVSLGSITYTDAGGNKLRDDKPSEFELSGAYAFKLSEKFSVGLTGKYAYSNLTGGSTVGGVDTKPAVAGAADLSFTYFNKDAKIGGSKGAYVFAATINNVGNKVTYSATAKRDFLPMNLKLATSYDARIDSYNRLLVSFELQKLLVPTSPILKADGTIASGKNNDVGVISGMLQSFNDAPGVLNADSTGAVKGTRLKEELSEINIATGLEYWYNDVFAIRSGFFYENKNKGNRRYINFGAGFKYNKLGIDISYLVSLGKNSPLANTLRVTLLYSIGEDKKSTL